ncbi:MAG: NVEALA domain-containing protein [Bacteroidales bacterium]|jgi:hypothetical protein|nr:NVEALA domain-containing protein [Bacteroidales bacterium]
MKKVIFGSIAVLALAILAAFNVNFNFRSNKLSDISLANVEALANETGSSSRGTPTSTVITDYEYNADGSLKRTIQITVTCCYSGTLICSSHPSC